VAVVAVVGALAGAAFVWITAATAAAGTAVGSLAAVVSAVSSLLLLSWSALPVEVPSPDFAVLVVSDLESDLLSLDEVLSVLLPELSAAELAEALVSFDDLDWSVVLRELELLLGDVVLLARGEGCVLDGGGLLDGSAEAAASTSAEKLSVYCDGSGRVDFGAVLWKAVLAWMSVETLNTLEPFAIEQSSRCSKERAKPARIKFRCYIR
jgi:hypothetical protein